MENNVDHNHNCNHQLIRRVTAFTAACLLISNMIGVGIFGTTGFMARDIGHPLPIMLLWILGGIYAVLGALSYCELGAAMPQAGGEYVYITRAYGPIWGFLSGWTSFTIAFSAAIASAAYLFAAYLKALLQLPELSAIYTTLIALAVVWCLTLVHIAGVKTGGFVQNTLTTIKVAAIALLLLAGLVAGKGDWNNLTTPSADYQFSLSALLVSFVFITYSYSGWNAASYIAGEIAEPQRNIPRATIWGTICVAIVYLALNIFYLYALPIPDLAADPVEPVAEKSAVAALGNMVAPWLTALLSISILGTASAMIWVGPRVYYAMAANRVFPAMFADTGRSGGAPVKSTVLQSCWVSILVVFGGFEQLVMYAGFAMIVFSGLAVGSVLVLRTREPELARPYRVRPYPAVPVLYLVLSLMVMGAVLYIRPAESLLGILTVAAGVPFYVFWKRRT